MTTIAEAPVSEVPLEDNSEKTNLQFPSYGILAILTFAGVFATGIPEPAVIGKVPLSFLLYKHLHCSLTQISAFFLIVTIPWFAMRPLFGLVSDAFPLFGTRRRHYVLLTTALAALGWIVFIWLPHTYISLLIACFLLNVCMAFGATVIGGVMLDAGRKMSVLDRLTSVRVAAQCSIGMFAYPIGVALASSGLGVMAGANAALLIAFIPLAFVLLKERPIAATDTSPFRDAGRQLKTFFSSKAVWLMLVIVGLFYFAPGYGTVQYGRQVDNFHLSPMQIGWLTSIASGTGVAVALLCSRFSRRWTPTLFLWLGVPLLALSNFAYLYYSSSFARNAFIDGGSSTFFFICEVALYSLAARATPAGCEAMGFAVLVGFRNLCLLVADLLGSSLWDHQRVSFWQLLALNSGTTLLILILIPLLPRQLTAKHA